MDGYDLGGWNGSTDLAVHGEKKRFISAWVAEHGTPDQQARHAAAVLPAGEVIEAIAEDAFSALRDRPRYVGIDHVRLQAHVRGYPAHRHAVVSATDVAVTVANAASVFVFPFFRGKMMTTVRQNG